MRQINIIVVNVKRGISKIQSIKNILRLNQIKTKIYYSYNNTNIYL